MTMGVLSPPPTTVHCRKNIMMNIVALQTSSYRWRGHSYQINVKFKFMFHLQVI